VTSEPNYTPKSELTLSAAPENLQVPSGPLTDLRSERDPLTPELIRELEPAVTESELRALWGDR
jgi:hypothetical protein